MYFAGLGVSGPAMIDLDLHSSRPSSLHLSTILRNVGRIDSITLFGGAITGSGLEAYVGNWLNHVEWIIDQPKRVVYKKSA